MGMVLETLEDIHEARKITFNGNTYEHHLLDTIEANIKDMVAHFKGTKRFESIQQKTDHYEETPEK